MSTETSTQKPNFGLRYALVGALFGLLFPLISSGVWIYTNGLELTWQNFALAQLSNPLQWIIDTAPLFLGLFAYLAGARQGQVEELNRALQTQLQDRDHLVRDLEGVKTNLEQVVNRQVVQLLTAAEVAREALTIQDLEELLQRTTQLISQRFGFYHTGIFLIDPTGEYTVLRAASSEGGQQMLMRQHKLKIGETGIVGHVAGSGEPRIALDVGSDSAYFNNPDLPMTSSEMALPLIAREHIIGVLDVQSVEKNAFSEDDLKILQTLANQVALAIDNALLLAQSQAALQEVQHLYQMQEGQAWRQHLEQRSLAFEYDLMGVRASNPQAQDGAEMDNVEDQAQVMSLPIEVRGQPIGSIQLERDPNDPAWSSDEQDLIQTAVNQMVLSLENARLLEETQQRAEYERFLAQLSARLWASGDVNTILRAALEELGRALQVSEGVIRLDAPELAEAPMKERR